MTSEKFIDTVLGTIKAVSERLEKRIAAVEVLAPIPGPTGRDGKDGLDGKHGEKGLQGDTGPAGRDGIDGVPGKDGTSGRDGIDGKDGASGKDGRDGKDAEPPDLDAIALKAAELIPVPKAITLDEVTAIVDQAVTKAIAALPKPEDGAIGPQGLTGERGEPGPPGRDVDETIVRNVQARIASVEKSLSDMPRQLDPDEAIETFSAILRKELADLAPLPRVQKRVLRDASGQIDRVIEEAVP